MSWWYRLRVVARRFSENVSGQTSTEYVILLGMVVMLCCYLYHPDNAIFYGMRTLYNRITLMLVLPGP